MYVFRAYAGIGSRETPPEICEAMTGVAGWLAKEQWTLYSGAAHGADAAFEEGAVQYNGRRNIYLPWPSFNGHHSRLHTPPLEAYTIAKQFHPAWDKLSRGGRALMARNVQQIGGAELINVIKMVICWTPGGRLTGGTAQALRIAQHEGIPIINLGSMSLSEAEERIQEINEQTKRTA